MDLETCKRKLIDELLAHEKDELKKSCAYQIDRIISKSRGFSVGTVRVWNGQKHRKVAPGKWVPVYDGDGRAASQSAAHVARQIKNANDFKELGEIVSQNLRRFTVGGKLLPVAQAVLEAARKRRTELGGRERWYATRGGVVSETERREQLKSANEEDKKLLDGLNTSEPRKKLISAYIRQASGDMETKRDKLHALCKDGTADRIMDKIVAGYRPVRGRGVGRNINYFFQGTEMTDKAGLPVDGGDIDKAASEFAMTLWKNKDKGDVMECMTDRTDETLKRRIDTGKRCIDEFFKKYWDSKVYADMGRDRLMDLWAVGDAKRYACIVPETLGLKGKAKKEALELNGKIEDALKKYASEVFEEYKAKDGKDAVRHDGEYVLTRSGSRDFGEITPEIAKVIRRQSGKIRLETGFHNDSTGDGFGEAHIERESRIKQLKQNGFDSARDFVETVSSRFDSIYKGKGVSIILSMRNSKNRNIEFVELKPSSDGDYWSVSSALVAHEGYLKNKTPLWIKSDNGVQQSGQGRAQTNQQKPPSAVSGNPDSSNIPQPSPSVKRKLLDTFEWNGAGNGREESYSGDTEKFIRQQVKEAIEKKDVDALYYMLKSKDRYMNARFAVQYARDCFNEMEGENGISFPRAHWTSWKYEESDLKGALKKWADKKKAESKKTKKSCAERINKLKKAVFAGMGETA